MPRTRALDLRRRRFGRLRVLEETDQRRGRGMIVWRCQCDCGTMTFVIGSNLVSGNTQSCGCWQRAISRRPNQHR